MSRHQHQVRPRYGRIAVLCSSVSVTTIAVLGGVGVLPSAAGAPQASGAILEVAHQAARAAQVAQPDPGVTSTGKPAPDETERHARQLRDTALPPGSGSGKRVVFSESRQRVWLVDGGHDVARTYLVSGSLSDNLDPGTYEVFSRSEQAWGIDDSGTMKYFVRFAHGDNAAIGFHDIPIDDGKLVQTPAQLGTPQSHGCVRQLRSDAIALWKFAPLGTTVVVTP